MNILVKKMLRNLFLLFLSCTSLFSAPLVIEEQRIETTVVTPSHTSEVNIPSWRDYFKSLEVGVTPNTPRHFSNIAHNEWNAFVKYNPYEAKHTNFYVCVTPSFDKVGIRQVDSLNNIQYAELSQRGGIGELSCYIPFGGVMFYFGLKVDIEMYRLKEISPSQYEKIKLSTWDNELHFWNAYELLLSLYNKENMRVWFSLSPLLGSQIDPFIGALLSQDIDSQARVIEFASGINLGIMARLLAYGPLATNARDTSAQWYADMRWHQYLPVLLPLSDLPISGFIKKDGYGKLISKVGVIVQKNEIKLAASYSLEYLSAKSFSLDGVTGDQSVKDRFESLLGLNYVHSAKVDHLISLGSVYKHTSGFQIAVDASYRMLEKQFGLYASCGFAF